MKESSEFYNLLNPAFCGEILRHCIKKYQMTSLQKMPYSLSFLILPIVLSQEFRERIDPYTHKPFSEWIRENNHLVMKFPKRAQQLVPITKQTLLFLIQNKSVNMDKSGNLEVEDYALKGSFKEIKTEEDDCFKKAETIGKWFAKMKTPNTIYSLLGVSP